MIELAHRCSDNGGPTVIFILILKGGSAEPFEPPWICPSVSKIIRRTVQMEKKTFQICIFIKKSKKSYTAYSSTLLGIPWYNGN